MPTLKQLIITLTVSAILMTQAASAAAVEPMPSSFYGTLHVNGSFVPMGTAITAYINDVQYALSSATLENGEALYELAVPGDDPEITGIQGGVEGDMIAFQIGDLVTDQTGTWHTDTNVQLDLSATHVPTGFTCVNLDPKSTSTTTGEKPQSKVWTYDGSWYAVFPTLSGASSPGTWVWRLAGTTWTEELKLSTRTDTHADVLVDGMLAHILLWADSNTQLSSIEFQDGSYQFWGERLTPVDISLPGSETATLALDSTGEMWLATRLNVDEIVVFHSPPPYGVWVGPIVLESGVFDDDIAVITALPNGSVGVFWSNQITRRFGFRYHLDGAPATEWSVDEVPASQSAENVGAGMADDHMNVAVAANSTLYVAIKTSYDASGYPKMALLVRRSNGSWDDLYPVDTAGTRPLVLLDDQVKSLTYIYTSAEGNNPIVYQQSSTKGIAFDGRKTLRSESYNDVSSMKANIEDDFVVIYSNGTVVAGQHCSKVDDAPPIISDIPDQTILEGGAFTSLNLDDFVTDVDNPDDEIIWTSIGSTYLTVSIIDRVAMITTPNPDWNGSETILLRATDPDSLFDEEPVTFTVTAVNDPPVLETIGPQVTVELVPFTFTARAVDVDLPVVPLAFYLDAGSAGSIPPGASIGPVSGIFTWTPTEAQGPDICIFDVCVTDGLLSDCETVTLEVSEAPTAPLGVPDSYLVDVPIFYLVKPGVLANDSDVDLPATVLEAYLVSGTTHGDLVLEKDGSFWYIPDDSKAGYAFSGIDTFTYRVFDGALYSDAVTVTLMVNLVRLFLPLIGK